MKRIKIQVEVYIYTPLSRTARAFISKFRELETAHDRHHDMNIMKSDMKWLARTSYPNDAHSCDHQDHLIYSLQIFFH